MLPALGSALNWCFERIWHDRDKALLDAAREELVRVETVLRAARDTETELILLGINGYDGIKSPAFVQLREALKALDLSTEGQRDTAEALGGADG